MSDFAKNIRKFRKQKGYSQTELAKKLNYGYTAIANYESGRNEPSLDVLIVLADALGVTVDELLGVEKNPEEKRLLSAFQKLDAEEKMTILNMMDTLQS